MSDEDKKPEDEQEFGAGVFEELTATPEPEEAPPAPVAEEEPTEPEGPTLSSTLSDLGFRDVESEEDAQARLLQAYQEQLNQAAALEQRAREAEIRAAMSGMQPQQQPQVTQPAQESPQYWPSYPSVDPQMISKYRETFVDPETQQISVRWADGTPRELRDNYDRFTSEVEQWTNKLAYEPEQTLTPIIESLAERKVRQILETSFGFAPEEIGSRLDLSGENRTVQNFMDRYQEHLYDLDPVTRQPTNRFSEFGAKVDAAMIEGYNLGLESRSAQLQYAQKTLANEFAAIEGRAAQVTAEEVREERKKQKMQRGGQSRDLSGSVPRQDDEVQNAHLSPGQTLAAAMREAGEL